MNLNLQFRINQDPRQRQFLRENSYWYKALNRNENSFFEFLDDMKVKYKLTTSDKINRTIDNIGMLHFLYYSCLLPPDNLQHCLSTYTLFNSSLLATSATSPSFNKTIILAISIH